MDFRQLKKICAITLIGYLIGGVLFYLIASNQLISSTSISEMVVSPENVTGEITTQMVLEQPIQLTGDEVYGITLRAANYARENIGNLTVELLDNGVVIETEIIDVNTVEDNSDIEICFEAITVSENADYELRVTADSEPGKAISLYHGVNYNLGKGSISRVIKDEQSLKINGNITNSMLCYKIKSIRYHWFGKYFWYVYALGVVLLAVYALHLMNCFKNKKKSKGVYFLKMVYRYKFLVSQLVGRDFKKKYKRSVLGVFWSLLNPIMTMAVQYIVFSTLFKSNIPNFALYLIIGIVCFNFFSEASSTASQSIVGNASLITKVYMPKVIYPISSILSSTVNLVIALLPLLLVMLITLTPLRAAALLMVFPLFCLLICSLGFGLLLSAMMVFFRDVQFLWNVLTMIWLYVTPIFYPISILPSWMIAAMQLNPLYHIITFVRMVLMEGVSPAPGLYLACIISAIIPFTVGWAVFRKLQDKFILQL